MTRRSYTEEQKAEALALYELEGPSAVQAKLGIAKATVAGWAVANGVRTVRNERTAEAVEAARLDRELVREQLRDEMLRKALDLLGRMDLPHIDFKGKDADKVTYPKPSPSGCQSYATAAAILVDKFRLEIGEATGRTEHQLTSPVDEELARLAEQIEHVQS